MKKKVLFIMYSLTGGGAEKVLVDVLHDFDYNRYDVELALVLKEGIYLHDIPESVKMIKLFNRATFYLGFGLVKFLNLHFVNRFLIKWKIRKRYDTIISFMEGYPVVVHSYLTDQAFVNISWIHTDLFANHYTSFLSVYGSKMEESCYAKMDKLVFVSSDSASQFDRTFSVKVPKVVIYNPIPKESIIRQSNDSQIPKSKLTIGNVARLVKQKRLDRLMNVAKRLKDEKYDVEFWLIGEGGMKESLLAQREQLGLESVVKFLGFKKPAYPYMKQLDIFLLTSSAEGYPLSVCEAMSLGIPICATRTTGTLEILDNGKYGVLTEQDENSIFEAVKLLIDNADLRKEFQKKSLERSEIFDIKKTMEEIYSVM